MTIIKQHYRKVALAVLLLTLALGVAHAARTGGLAAPGPREIRLAQRTIATSGQPTDGVWQSVSHAVGAPGIVEPRDREIKVAPQVAGVVATLDAHEGDIVHSGDILLTLHAESERAALQAAQADVQGARAQLQKLTRGARSEDVAAAQAEAEAAAARAQSANDVWQRTDTLFARHAATADECNRARFAAAADAAAAAAAQARYQAVVRGSRAEDVATARATLAQAEARQLQAQANLDRLTLRAPSDGEVLQVLVRAGEYSNPASGGAVVLGDTRALRVRLDVDERDVARVTVGQRGDVHAEGYDGRRFTGSVVEISKRMGRKNVRTDEPTERLDTKILEVVFELDGHPDLPQGLRVTGVLHHNDHAKPVSEGYSDTAAGQSDQAPREKIPPI